MAYEEVILCFVGVIISIGKDTHVFGLTFRFKSVSRSFRFRQHDCCLPVGSVSYFLCFGFALSFVGCSDVFTLSNHAVVDSILVFVRKIKFLDFDHLNLNTILFRIIIFIQLLKNLVRKRNDSGVLIDDCHAVFRLF